MVKSKKYSKSNRLCRECSNNKLIGKKRNPKLLINSILKITDGKKTYIKICPICKEEKEIKTKHIAELGVPCRKCSIEIFKKNNPVPKGSKRDRSLFTKEFSENVSKGMKKSNYYEIVKTEEYKKKLRKPKSLEHSKKLREYRLSQMLKIYGSVAHSDFGCKIFEKFNEQLNTDGRHALNNGEKHVIGYSLDYYNEELKLIIESDGQEHYIDGKLREKDIIRQNKIILELPDFDFYRIQHKNGEVLIVKGNNKIKEILENIWKIIKQEEILILK